MFNKIGFVLLFIPLCILSGCAAIVTGDLAEKNLSEKPFPYKIDKVVNIGNDHEGLGLLDSDSFSPGFLDTDPQAEGPYTLEIHYAVTDKYTSGSAEFFTAISLGLIPMVSKVPVNVDFRIYNAEGVVMERKVRSDLRIFYGWLLAGIAEKVRPQDSVGVNEGSGIHGAAYWAVYQRLPKYITRQFEESGSGNK